MSAAGREKLWAREKSEKRSQFAERKPFHGVMAAREQLCKPREKFERRDWYSEDTTESLDRYYARRSMDRDARDEALSRSRQQREEDSSDDMSETHAVATGDDSGEDGLT